VGSGHWHVPSYTTRCTQLAKTCCVIVTWRVAWDARCTEEILAVLILSSSGVAYAHGQSLWRASVARVTGEEQWHRALACAMVLCHTNRASPEALGDQRGGRS
jgi:hypothetical protein